MSRGLLRATVPMAMLRSRLPALMDESGEVCQRQRTFAICRNGQLAQEYGNMSKMELQGEMEARRLPCPHRCRTVDAMREHLCQSDEAWARNALIASTVIEERLLLS